MRKTVTKLGAILIGSILLSGCATIVGGSKYNAHVVVSNRPNAKIMYGGDIKGTGNASFKVKRNEANRFSLTVKEDGWEDQSFNFTTRTFRGAAFVGTILGWTGLVNGIPIPWGIMVDLATGAVWKPNVHEQGVDKIDYKNFSYILNSAPPVISHVNKNLYDDIIYLKNGSIIKGLIIEEVPGVKIKIQSKNGNIFVYKSEEIERIEKEESRF